MAWLLIDNSNNRTKFRLGDASGLADWRETVPTADLTSSLLKTLTTDLDFSGVVLASVVPDKARLITTFLEKRCVVHELTFRSPLGFGFDLKFPEQIGNDRLANVLALKALYGAPGIAIDFGTAVTFSILTSEGDFAGGVIAPGMAAMTGYLVSSTAQLPEVDALTPQFAIGRTTIEAMRSGAVIGQRGMVREILTELISEIEGIPKVVATGGGAQFTAGELEEVNLIDPDLTIQGLLLLAQRVFK